MAVRSHAAIRRRFDTGDAHTMLIALVVIGMVIGLVIVFVRSANKQAPNKSPSTAASVDETAPTTKEYCTLQEKLCFDYPSTWSIQASTIENKYSATERDTRDAVIIKDPQQNPLLYLDTGLTQLGGACDSKREPMMTIIDSQPTKVTGDHLVNEGAESTHVRTVYAIKYFKPTRRDDKKYEIGMGLTNATNATKPGSVNTCDLSTIVFNGKLKVDDSVSAIAVASMPFGGRNQRDRATYTSESTARQALGSDRMEAAYEILKSFHYTN